MLATVISQYLKTNRRLVVPQLGAFLVKEPNHTVIFSTLLTRDDGTLRTLLAEQGISEVEVSGILDRILFDVRFALENNESFTLEGVGSFSGDGEGKILFEMAPRTPEIEAQTEIESVTETEIETEIEPTLEEVEAGETGETDQTQYTLLDADPDLEGLNYGKSKQKRKVRAQPRKRGVDWWLIIGVTALALAAGAILYGFLRDGAGSSSAPFSEEFYAE